jgi:DNA-binding HxlR family transcriptional regulator
MEPVRSYGQYCPVARACEILGDRWTLLIVRELVLGRCHFNDIERGLPGISRTLLSQRLRHLDQVGAVARGPADAGGRRPYRLTPAGRELHRVIDSLTAWGARWAFGDPRPEELDPVLLLWWMRGRINRRLLPARRVVVQFDLRGPRRSRLWLVLEPADVSVCLRHPGFDADLIVTADLAALYRVWLGTAELAAARRAGFVEIDGPPALARAFPGWLELSPAHHVVRDAGRRRWSAHEAPPPNAGG